jgi:RNA 2',3'-cyclic 3'-phosphodiesterase
MRLFTGIDVPYQMRRNLELLLELLKPKARIAWSPLANLHVTTKFVGEWPDARLEELKEALRGVAAPAGKMKIGIRGLGWFPNPHHPRVLYVAVQAGPELAELARATGEACAALGIEVEAKEYRPHLTLARIRTEEPLVELKRAIAQLPSDDFGGWTAEAFHLYQSQLRPGGAIYTKLESYSFPA